MFSMFAQHIKRFNHIGNLLQIATDIYYIFTNCTNCNIIINVFNKKIFETMKQLYYTEIVSEFENKKKILFPNDQIQSKSMFAKTCKIELGSVNVTLCNKCIFVSAKMIGSLGYSVC